jgi:hypothetical protein
VIPACSATLYEDVLSPKDAAYRLGISDIPEKLFINTPTVQKEYITKDTSEQHSPEELTYADLSIKRISGEIATELMMEEKCMMSDLSLLWKGAATKSDTINFALYKLANPDADKPDEKSVKKVLTTIASMSTLVGAGVGNPLIAAGSLIGGNVLGIMSQDTKALNYKYTKVTDADMIVLITKVDNMQKKVVDQYFDYMTTYNMLKITESNLKKRMERYNSGLYKTEEQLLVADAYYRNAVDNKAKLELEFLENRAELEQLVGLEALIEFEKLLYKQ